MNYEYYLEFLDIALRKRIKNNTATILQKNLFVVLSSMEMIALARLLSILHISIVIPFRYLAGKTAELGEEHDWCPFNMGDVLDVLDKKLEELIKKPELILDEKFMMGMFDKFREELPPFDEYLTDLFQKKRMKAMSRDSGARLLPFKEAVRKSVLAHQTN